MSQNTDNVDVAVLAPLCSFSRGQTKRARPGSRARLHQAGALSRLIRSNT
jgi:hypothetical protein